MESFLQALQDTSIATAIREGESLFPWIECVHVLALTLVIGSIAIVDLRLLGLASRAALGRKTHKRRTLQKQGSGKANDGTRWGQFVLRASPCRSCCSAHARCSTGRAGSTQMPAG